MEERSIPQVAIPPSPLTFRRFVVDYMASEGVLANEAVGRVLTKIIRDLQVMPMVQFAQWYREKREQLLKAKNHGSMFVYGHIIVDMDQVERLLPCFSWSATSDRSVTVL